jgi:hypothetical protein
MVLSAPSCLAGARTGRDSTAVHHALFHDRIAKNRTLNQLHHFGAGRKFGMIRRSTQVSGFVHSGQGPEPEQEANSHSIVGSMSPLRQLRVRITLVICGDGFAAIRGLGFAEEFGKLLLQRFMPKIEGNDLAFLIHKERRGDLANAIL